MSTQNKINKWPGESRAAIALTMDNMGEAADLNRGLWPQSDPVGNHYSVTKVLPTMLSLLNKHNISATYFVEAWNFNLYTDFVKDLVKEGNELAWHAWQHENWAKLDSNQERENFNKSFGHDGIKGFRERVQLDTDMYKGFRPPGGQIHGARTLQLCREHDIKYLSPAGEEAALVGEQIVILPFKWTTVDAYYYMESFTGLRKLKGENSEPQSTNTLVQRYIAEVDNAIEQRQFLSLLFHPFLTNTTERMDGFERVLRYLVVKRDTGVIWLARCSEVVDHIRENPDIVGSDPKWDRSEWR